MRAPDVLAVEYCAHGVAHFVESPNVRDCRRDGAVVVFERGGERTHRLRAADSAVEEKDGLTSATARRVAPLDAIDDKFFLGHAFG